MPALALAALSTGGCGAMRDMVRVNGKTLTQLDAEKALQERIEALPVYTVDPLDPDKGFEVVGTNSLDEMALATPAIAQGSLFLRTRGHLYRLTESP